MTTEDWPVVSDFATVQVAKVPYLKFIAVTNGRGGCAVIAMDDLVAIGTLRWWVGGDVDDPNAGRISYVYVGEQWQRQGVANAMLTVANGYADQYSVPRPRHAARRSPAGNAWAATHGADPATEVTNENATWGTPKGAL